MTGEIIWVIGSRRWLPQLQEPAESCRYQRAYVDFFEDQLVLNGYDWRLVLSEFLFTGKEPLINCMIAGRMSLLDRRVAAVLENSQVRSWPSSHPPGLRFRTLLS